MRADGRSWREIGEALGIHPRTAQKYGALLGWNDLVNEATDAICDQYVQEQALPNLRRLRELSDQDDDRKSAVKATVEFNNIVKESRDRRLGSPDGGRLGDVAGLSGPAPSKLGTVTILDGVITVRRAPPQEATPTADKDTTQDGNEGQPEEP